MGANFRSAFICRKRSFTYSRRRNGRWLFSTRLLTQRPTSCFYSRFSSFIAACTSADHRGVNFIHLPIHLVEIPLPLAKTSHPADPLAANVGCKQRTKSIPPLPHSLVVDVDGALSRQVLDVARTQRRRK